MPAGRRPGDPHTRATILTAARLEFVDQGYNDATIRGIARRAEVDPALVYHYFGTKSALFVESAELPVDPRQVADESRQSGTGQALVERFLAQWEEDPDRPGQRFVAMVQAVAGSEEAARSMSEFLTERVWANPHPGVDDEGWARQRALVASQLVGTAWMRYVMKMEPLASASRAEVAALIGPGVDRALRREG